MKLFEIEANNRDISIDELRNSEIIQKSKKVTHVDIIEYSQINNIKLTDSTEYLSIKAQLININRRFRFEVFIDSLRKVYNVTLISDLPRNKLESIDRIHSQVIGNMKSSFHIYLIADYDCPTCKDNYSRVFNICKPYLDKIQLHFVYYSDKITDKAVLAEAIANQGRFWDLNSLLFEIAQINDELISNIIRSYSLDSSQLKSDYYNYYNKEKLVNNQKTIESLKIYSVPTIIIDDEIIPGYTDSEELVQIINYELLNQ